MSFNCSRATALSAVAADRNWSTDVRGTAQRGSWCRTAAAGASGWMPCCGVGNRVVLILASLLALAALLVVGNTVRVDIASRSEEIGVLLLVGASRGLRASPVSLCRHMVWPVQWRPGGRCLSVLDGAGCWPSRWAQSQPRPTAGKLSRSADLPLWLLLSRAAGRRHARAGLARAWSAPGNCARLPDGVVAAVTGDRSDSADAIAVPAIRGSRTAVVAPVVFPARIAMVFQADSS